MSPSEVESLFLRELAARHLGRLWARGRNERLTVAFANLALDPGVG